MPSNDMLARYLQAVGFWLPQATKQDILAEISEDLHSQIDDRGAGLGRPLTEAEVADILKQRGRPVVVAGSFLPQRHLIGPVMFPIYVFVLKIVALCYLMPWLCVWLGFVIFDRSYNAFHGLFTFWALLWTVFGAVTFIFATLDRTSSRMKFVCDWDPRKLPKISPKQCQGHKTSEAVGGIVFGILAVGWLLAIPSHPFLVLGPAAFFIKFAPVWCTVYPWMIVLAVAGIAENIIKLMRSLPEWAAPVFRFATLYVNAWMLAKLLRVYTYFTVPAQSAAQWVPVVNTVLYYCFIANAVALAIAFVVSAWKLTQLFERSRKPAIPRTA